MDKFPSTALLTQVPCSLGDTVLIQLFSDQL